MVELDGDCVRFTHPLLASAAYQGLDAIARRRLHRRLAEVVPDLDERVRHPALSTDAPDSDVARALEEAADTPAHEARPRRPRSSANRHAG